MIKTIYSQKNNFIIIGLTGRIGSGCSTAAQFLSSSKKEHKIKPFELNEKSSDNQRKKYILDKFYQKNWKPFISIKASDIITAFILKYNFDDLNNIIEEFNKKIVESSCDKSNPLLNRLKYYSEITPLKNSYKSTYDKFHNKYKDLFNDMEENKYSKNKKVIKKLFKTITKKLPIISNLIRSELSKNSYKNYTDLYQYIGDNIRLYGDIKLDETKKEAKNVFSIVRQINYMIKIIRAFNNFKEKETLIAIDAIRNPLESLYLKERYSAYYLVSITANDKSIRNRLMKTAFMNNEDIERQSKKETEDSLLKNLEGYVSQNIQKCIEKSDIFILNNGKIKNNNFKELFGQLIKYTSLIKHPGLVTPSLDEKMMQIAYTAKLNSACLSRQVGASITNENGSLKAVGWNSVAEGQTPCLLRNRDELLNHTKSCAYSKYEKSIDFKQKLSSVPRVNKKYGLNQSFCFKTIYIKDNEKEKGNQVHTRSLHAEENAFLQVAKYGGEAIKNGILYSTASPCELCSKKAYQLGIQRVVYIDPYPGIVKEQILQSGKYPPKIDLFKDAIGIAYHKLYEQIVPFKDELIVLSTNTEIK